MRNASLATRLTLSALAAGACCIYGVWGLSVSIADYEDRGWGNPPPAVQVHDTVTFLAEERFYEATCRTPAPPSDVAPGKYEWSVSGLPAVLLAPGVVTTTGTGAFQLTVSTNHDVEWQDFLVVPRAAAVRLTPDSVVLAVGDTVSFLVEALDGGGAVIASLSRASGLLRLSPDSISNGDPIAANQADSDGVHFLWRAYRVGTLSITAALAVYGTEGRVAHGTIVVR